MRRVNFNSLTFSYIFQVLFFQSHFYFYSHLIELSGDFEKSPGPNSKSDQRFSVCHWKIQSLIPYNCIHHFDIICFSETYLNSDISSDNEDLDIPDYRSI